MVDTLDPKLNQQEKKRKKKKKKVESIGEKRIWRHAAQEHKPGYSCYSLSNVSTYSSCSTLNHTTFGPEWRALV